MQRFRREYLERNAHVDILIYDVRGSGTDVYRDVVLVFDSGKRLTAGFWIDPMSRGENWWDGPGMAIVVDVSNTETIIDMVDEVLKSGSVEDRFEPIPDAYEPGDDPGK
jgi:hypothetical protein